MNSRMPLDCDCELIHIWHHCHHCQSAPIIGKRYHCISCQASPDTDLCEKCYDLFQNKELKHPSEPWAARLEEVKEHRFTIHDGKIQRLYYPWLQTQHIDVPLPQVQHPFVTRPIYYSGTYATVGEYAFAVNFGNHKIYLITTLHALDMIMKKKAIDCTDRSEQYTGRELPKAITKVELYDAFTTQWWRTGFGSAGSMLVLPNSRANDKELDFYRDIAIFELKSPTIFQLRPAPLASESPKRGDPVWLVAQSPEVSGKAMFKATVVEVSSSSMVFLYENLENCPHYTSGAPIVNRSGQVVGMAGGQGKLSGQTLGYGSHVESIRQHLRESCTL